MLDKGTLQSLLGPVPAKPPLEVSVLETVDNGDYEQLKIQYNVESNERINAYLLIPKEMHGPAPAVFCHHQHAGQFDLGKSEVVGLAGDPNQALGPELVRRGYIVLAPDAIAFEERNWSFPTGQAQYYELVSRIVKGETLLAKILHDVSVGIDYLCTRDDVDSNRVGFIGHSYGGRMAIWAPAVDDRIKASVSNCGCINYEDSLVREVGIQAEFCVPNILKLGDVEDVVRLIAPRALFLSATDDDKYSRGAQQIVDFAKSAFPKDQLKLKVWNGKHVFTDEMRSTAYQFLKDKL